MTPEQFLQLARALPEPTCLVSGDGLLLAANPPAAALLGLTGEALHGKALAELVSDPPEKVKEYLRACSRSREMVLGSLCLRPRGGDELWCRCEGSVVSPWSESSSALVLLRFRTKDSAASKFLLLNRKIDELAKEIRERRRAQEEAQEQRERFRVTLSSIGDAVIATDARGVVNFINRVAQELTGWAEDEAEGKPLHQIFRIVNEHTREEVENPVAKVLRHGSIVGLANHTVVIARDGTERPIDDSGAPIRNEEGKIIGVVLVFRDITERKQAEERRAQLLAHERAARAAAEESSRLKDEFLATLSHELRTPLTAILGWASMLRTIKFDQASAARALETIERNAKAQTQIVEDVLDVSRIITGKLRLDVRPVQLLPVIEEAADTVRPTAEAKGIRLRAELDPGAGAVAGDPARLQQVMWNLLSNAIKYTPEGGSIIVLLERAGSHARIVVNDTGQGISRDFLPLVFDRFRQADGSITRKHGGLGLGLAIVRHLVELHGGTVRAESAGEGRGATFTVELPVMAARGEGAEASQVSRASAGAPIDYPPALDNLRVLVVDDEADTRLLLTTLIENCGAQARAVTSTAEAMEALEQFRPDILVSDIGMPGEDGYALIRKVRALGRERGGRVPAVALTAYAREDDRMRALLAGYQVHVTKPVNPAELVAVIGSLAGLSGRR